MAKSITVALELDDRSFRRGLSNADKQVDGLSKRFGGLSTAIKAAAAIGAGFAVKGVFDATLKMENFRTTLTAYLGSQQAANREIERLTELANKLPQDLDNITEGFIVLQRNGIDTTSASLEAFSKVAAGNSKDFTQLAEAVADALTGEFERLKEFGVKVSKENDQFAIRFADGSSKVVDSAQEVVEAVRAQGEEGGKFADVIAGPLNQAFSNLNGVLFEVSSAFGEGFAPAVSEAANAAKEMIKANKEAIASFGRLIGEGLQWFLDNMDTVVLGIKAFAAAWAAFAVANLIQGIATLVTSLGTLRNVLIGVNAVLLANPIAAVAAALAAAAVLIITNWETVKAFFERLWVGIQDLGQLAALNIELYWEKLRAWFLGTFAPALQTISDGFFVIKREALSAFAGVKAAANDPLDAFNAFEQASKDVEDQLDAQRAAQNTMADSAQEAADAVAETEAEIAALENAIANRAKAATEEQAEALKEVAPAAEEAADSCQMFKTEIEQLQSALDASTKSTDKNTASTKKNTAEQAKAAREAALAADRQARQVARINAELDDNIKAGKERIKNEIELLDYFGEEKRVKEAINDVERERNRLLSQAEQIEDPAERERQIKNINEAYNEQVSAVEDLTRAHYEASRSFEQGFKEAYNNFKEDSMNAATLASDLFTTAADDWRNAWIEAANTGKLSFGDLLQNMKNRIVGFLADAAFIKLTDVIADAFGINVSGRTAGSGSSGTSSSKGKSSGKSIIDTGIDFVKGLFGFADGGYVAGNKSVIVGERGPEVFTPAGSGTIIPNFAGMSGGGGGTVIYNISAVDSKSFVNLLSKHPDVIHGMVATRNAEMMTGGRF